MRSLIIRLIAVAALLVGIVIGAVWPSSETSTLTPQPCRSDLAVAENQTDAPIMLSIDSADCAEPNFAAVVIGLQNITTRPIQSYEFLIRRPMTVFAMTTSLSMVALLPWNCMILRSTSCSGARNIIASRCDPVFSNHQRLISSLSLSYVEFMDGTAWPSPRTKNYFFREPAGR